jgi:hypothetical protein
LPIPLPLSRHQTFRLRALSLRLNATLETLCALPNRRAPLMPGLAGPALRALHEAQAFVEVPRFVPESKPLQPGELFPEMLFTFDHIKRLSRLSRKAVGRSKQKSYRRRSGLH